MQRLLRQLLPFLFFGIAIATFTFGLVLLAYLFLIGATVGVILFIINWLRYKFFASKTMTKSSRREGRIIDSNDWTKHS
jgi:hypothetical protein